MDMQIIQRNKKRLCLFGILFFILSGCAKKDVSQDKIIATVNNQPVLLKDLQRQLVLKVRVDPAFKITPQNLEDELNTIIDRRLLIQEAMQKGLAQEERFVNTIKSFWEQTLIRDLMDYKKRQFQDYIYVTDDEVKDYYQKLMLRVKFRVIESKDRASLEKLLKEALKKEALAWDKTIGPVVYEDIAPGVLQEAFALNPGQAKIFFDRGTRQYYLVQMQEKEAVSIADLKDIYDEVKSRLKEHKYMIAFDAWLGELRQKAKIHKNIGCALKEVK